MPSRPKEPDAGHRAAVTSWDNPIPAGRYDLVVLGGDRAAGWAAREAASLGAHVAWLVGTGDGSGDGSGDAAADRIGDPGAPVDVYHGDPHFIAPDAVHLAGRRLHFTRALIAVRAAPVVPPVDGIAGVPRLDADALGDTASLPRRIAVLGAGATGCAAAQALARRGSHVTLFESAARILPREAPEAAAIVAAALRADGVAVRAGQRVTGTVRQARAWAVAAVAVAAETAGAAGEGVRAAAHEAAHEAASHEGDAHADDDPAAVVDAVVLCTGRRADLSALDLAAAGIELDGARLRLDVRLRTTNPRVFAAGDAALAYPSFHGALACADVALRNALFDGRRRADVLSIPRVVWTEPVVASVGLLPHEPEAGAVPLDTLVHRMVLRGASSPRATDRPPDVSKGSDADGLVALHLAADTDAVLGATLVGPDAATAIGEIARAIDAGIPLFELARAIRPPGPFADALRALVDSERRRRRSPGGRALAARWLAARRALADRATSRG